MKASDNLHPCTFILAYLTHGKGGGGGGREQMQMHKPLARGLKMQMINVIKCPVMMTKYVRHFSTRL